MPIIGNTVGTPQNPADWNVSDPLNVSNIAGKPTITQGEKKIDFQKQKASNLLDPTEPQDAVTLAYLNSREHPVGSIYSTFEKEDLPAAKFGGEWSLIEQGNVLLSAGSDYTPGSSYGAPSHSHNVSGYAKVNGVDFVAWRNMPCQEWEANYEIPSLPNGVSGRLHSSSYGAEALGTADAQSNLQPSIAIYIWRRTA